MTILARLVLASSAFLAASAGAQALEPLVKFEKPQRPGTVLVDVSARHLYHFKSDRLAEVFLVGVARPGIQFYGSTQIYLKRDNPVWVPTRNQRRLYKNLPASVPPGPDNPLGTRALNLHKNYRIHGTNQPERIGHAKSDGCVAMYNADIEHLFPEIALGARVVVTK